MIAAVRAWWFPAVPWARLAVFRTAVYAFVFVDVLVTTPWVADHGDLPGALYQPLLLGRLLPLPTPTGTVVSLVEVALLLAAAVALTGRAPRLAGGAVFFLYLEWMLVAFSYGKVDHDRFAFLVALAVLPTAAGVGGHPGDARALVLGNFARPMTGQSCQERDSEAAGWALRVVQVAVVLTYFLAAFAKLRFGGVEWLDSATLLRAVLRRGWLFDDLLVDHSWVLHMAQYALVLFELASPLLLAKGRVGRAFLATAFAFHAVTFLTVKILFLPHVVCLLAFLPLERVGERRHAASSVGVTSTG